MKILVLGASGFIGGHLVRKITQAGHEVFLGARRVAGLRNAVAVDYSRMTESHHWRSVVQGMDAVVNAVGIIRERGSDRFGLLHETAPRALFQACEAAGVRRVLQISALGADQAARTRFHLSKKRADDFLIGSDLQWSIVQPSLVFGAEGASSRSFLLMAALPVMPLPGNGEQRIQPIHIEDLCSLVLRLIEEVPARRTRVFAVGPRAVSFRELLETLRSQMGLGRTLALHIPLALVRLVIGRETLAMLLRGNTASSSEIERILDRPLRDVRDFVTGREAQYLRARAKLDWLLPMLRASVAATWIVSGVVSLGFYPISESLQLLARVGLAGSFASFALYSSALLDIALGVGVFAWRSPWLWRAQLALMAVYTVLLTVFIPELWLHPFGPVLKNIPLAAAIALLHELEGRR